MVGYFKSGMSEYDSTHVYVPLRELQKARGMIGPDGKGAVNQIQIKVRPGVDLGDHSVRHREVGDDRVLVRLRARRPPAV